MNTPIKATAANAALNTGNAITNIVNNAAEAARNVTNVATNAANNVTKNVNIAMNNAAVAATNLGTSMKNMMTPVTNNAVVNNALKPLNDAIQATPTDAPSLFVSLPIILITGLIIILVVLVVVFRDSILSAIRKFLGGVDTIATTVVRDVDTIATTVVRDVDTSAEAIAQDLDIVNKVVPTRKQVFNVSENVYTYSDAEPLCKALGAELATYDQVQKAWEKGADWCNYGWIKGQGAIYPTQESTFNSLQNGTTDDERLACGLVGVNGGYMDNPELRFGVNCYGDKPSETTHDLKNMLQNVIPPLTPEVLEQRKKELRYKSEIGQIGVLPFRKNAWSS